MNILEQKTSQLEYSASDIRRVLQELFPTRKLVLSQFTFYNQIGVARPTGETFRRGRRCYRMSDILPIACVIALKEKGIPLKNIESLPSLLQERSEQIFAHGKDCFVSGFGTAVSLQLPGDHSSDVCLDSFLDGGEEETALFWSYDVGELASRLSAVIASFSERVYKKAA